MNAWFTIRSRWSFVEDVLLPPFSLGTALLEYVLGLVGEIELVNGHIRIKEQSEKQK